MAKKEKSRRRIKKDMLEYLENAYDLTQLDYAKRIKPKKDIAKIYGLVTAFVVYAIGFAGGYYGWTFNNVSFEIFIKISWVLMLPASVAGVVTWMLSFNRLENRVRHDFFVIIKNIESEYGLIWRFKPLMSTFDPQNVAAKKVIAQSEAGEFNEIDVEVYADAVHVLFSGVQGKGGEKLSNETADEVVENFKQKQ
ncbi:MAG: hypothetical protein GXP19_08860 [Gammaproteobacteria bacterium]|nr:hypothetical protein [Gammaproteobacteria bacterium]